MIKNVYYDINNVNNKTIAVFSDFHYVEKYNEDLIIDIISNLKQHKPDYICIAGDIVDDSRVLENEILKNRLSAFFRFLGTIAPTLIVTGNHDHILYKKFSKPIHNNHDYYINLNIENVHYIGNNSKQIDNINFIGFVPHMDYYLKRPIEDKRILADELLNLEHLVKDEYYNVLLFHSPINILENHVLEKCKFMKKINLILSGHMHNGLTPEFINKIKGNRGIISPDMTFFPELARGTKVVDDITLVISGGIVKITKRTSKILSKTKYNKTSHIEYIKI